MKTAPITVTEMVLLGGVVVGGFLVWRAYTKIRDADISASAVLNVTAGAVDMRQTAPSSTLGKSQSWVADTVQKGQDAGASTFVTSFFTGLFK